ncbi:cytochrome c oxidase assembly factor Coa1 family protein [uncultured Tenacibaculum sp.]|uniref:cytochrome c oxidase assembly factor Coa1 family protein n=1 Tax=uncultured Tenacibaculum sp. TaxID=174713 RepID=UPI002604706B|nr:cytochrome c oxidase assembly factor Coa1 family protein [uncultured Tenacibaculum sp.]
MNKKIVKRLILIITIIISLMIIVTVGSAIKIKNSEAYPFAKEYIINDKEVHEKTGDILAFGSFPSGLIREDYRKIKAQIEIDVEGTKWSGKIIVIMERSKDSIKWKYKKVHYL